MKTICGTPQYISPEVIISSQYTNKTDLWAIGVITFMILHNQMPFNDQDNISLYKDIIKGNYAKNPEVRLILLMN